ncbi:MAG: MMPL family transporter [Rubripirellula sp.]|nr:MMPL family transporter [Rubripirellula sp.]
MKQDSSLSRRSQKGIPYALLILVAFFFFLPWEFRAARLSLSQKQNDVQDWLPDDFPETAELDWFSQHFAGESFVLATWDGCTTDDQRLKLFEQKLLHESEGAVPAENLSSEESARYQRARELGRKLELMLPGNDFDDWGGEDEKWLQSASGQWYYVTPSGELFRWEEGTNGPAAAIRAIKKRLGTYQLQGQLITAFGDQTSGQVANPFYNDLSLLCAPLFQSVQTGESIIAELTVEGGPLWPIDLTDEDRRSVVARRRALKRLTGTLFAPAVAPEFGWSADAFRASLPAERREQLPENFDALVEDALAQIVTENFGDSLEELKQASLDEKTDAFYAVFDTVEVEPPNRLTCVLVTLTQLAQDNLPFAVGRGVLGQPRGRLLELAVQSGIRAAPPPSMAPPPFNREPPASLAGMPALRMGGPPVDNMAIDEEGSITLVRLIGYSVVLGIVLSLICFGSLKITGVVFIVGGSSAIMSMAIVWWTSGRVDAILMSMPSLVYVLGLSGAIHVVNYYRDEVRKSGEAGAARRALRHAFLPCTLASLTTAIGLASLFTSNLAPISNFGLYAALGVLMTLCVLFSYLPAALQIFPPSTAFLRDIPTEPKNESRLSEWWAAAGRWITRHHRLVSVSCIGLLLASATGLMKIQTSVQLLNLFDDDSRIIHDYAWLEENFGKLVPMELVVRIPPSMQSESSAAKPPSASQANSQPLDILQRVEAIARIRTVVYRTLGEPGRKVVGQALAADTFLPPLPEATNGYSPIRAKFVRELSAASEQLRDNDYLEIEQEGQYANSELWRISLRVAALSDVDYGQFISTLRESVEPVLRAYETRAQLMRQLDSGDGSTKRKRRVMLVGSERPKSLAQADLLGEGGDIDQRMTYLATLGELLNGERIDKPRWLNVDAEKAKELVASEKWEKLVESFDAIVWLGTDSFDPTDFSAANVLIDGEQTLAKTTQPTLLPNRIPDVTGSGPMQVVYTGVVPVVYKAQRTLLQSLANSIGLAFVLIAAVMIWLLNPGRMPIDWLRPRQLGYGIAAGMVAMIPNVFPVLLVFGVMCHQGIDIDIGTMMTASVAMGVAVDDTIHFLAWFRENLDKGMHRVEAVIETYRRVGPAMTQTTVVGGLGLFVFSLSTFTPTQRFGTLMLVMLAAALVGDLILLPALLAGPAGKLFKPRARASQSDKSESAESNTETVVQDSDNDADDKDDAPPQLKVHFPSGRADPPHRLKGK